MAYKAALALAVPCIMVTLVVVVLKMITLSSSLVVLFRHNLPIRTDTRMLMSINIKAQVYQTLYWDAYLVLLFSSI